MANKWTYSIFFVLFLALASYIAAGIINMSGDDGGAFTIGGNVMVIPLKGMIVGGQSSEPFLSSSYAVSEDIIDALKTAQDDPSIEAIILDIDSGGGAAVPSHEIVSALKKLNKTKIALIHSVGASGAYWAASATDYIMADPLSVVGSIGVISSYLDFSGLLDHYNVTYNRLVAGKYKDMGSPFKELTPEEEELFQGQLDTMYEYFLRDVAKNRGLDVAYLRTLADGQVYTGLDALSLGLIDGYGGLSEAKALLEQELNTTVTFRVVRERATLSSLFGFSADNFAYHFGRGFAKEFKTEDTQDIMRLQLER